MTDQTVVPHLDELCNELLTLIEIEEAKLLNWGFFDVRLDLTTQLDTFLRKLPASKKDLWEIARQSGTTTTQMLQNLLDRKLVFRLNIAGNTFYRTRFAETIRLLYLLRQRFSFDDWQIASRLVSDLKIQLQRRSYPKRDIEADDLIKELRTLRVSSLYIEATKSLLQEHPGIYLKLALFQKEAILQQARNLRSNGEHAIVIGAGTSSGKTKAFYIPAFAEIASILTREYDVKVLALYPRTELLKDQLGEAFSEARKLDTLLHQQNKRSITIGAYYGDTPASAQWFLKTPPKSWLQNTTRDGWICPFFSCPKCHSQELTWYRKDLEKEQKDNQKGVYGKYARLVCPDPACRHEIKGEQLLLTRQQMIQQPPDILFTTTEMLNRRLSRTGEHHLFGISPNAKSLRLVLLDEIHTYEGVHGAQIAYLLWRWKHAYSLHHQNNLCFVGLSATLSNAETFFAKLIGMDVYQVNYIHPREKDLIEEGMEYNIVLKGDPVSGTSLLSTSVQAAMLLGRMLDLDSTSAEQATYGKKIFAFADKLDVLNRWYHIEQEAEFRRTLSQYRDYTKSDRGMRLKTYLQGQFWLVCQQIGHDLLTPLRVDLTSSQYRGVNAQANFIVATSTLEVGFNDPDVGMVLQHKAPRSMASFLQRKGRAGRRRQIRPWMVVVTSAYGRDRWAFQHIEQLFHPQLDAINLPIENYYVRKIQATYALMDWLAYVLKYEKGYGDSDIWDALSSDDRGQDEFLQNKRKAILRIIDELLQGGRRQHFQDYLMSALDIQNKEILYSVIWGEPRSIFFEVLPTIQRQLESNWQAIKDGKPEAWSDTIRTNPMPDFVPPTLYADLNLPELLLRIPEQLVSKKLSTNERNAWREDEYLPLLQAMQEFAPGHVNKRYSRKQIISEAHWLELPEEQLLIENMLPLHTLHIERSEIARRVEIDAMWYPVYQPKGYVLGIVPENVKNSSSGHLFWRSCFTPKLVNEANQFGNTPITQKIEATNINSILKLAPYSPWKHFFHKIESYTQTNGQWVEITRLATGVAGETYYKKGRDVRRKLHFTENGEPAALGFTIYADALRFECVPLDVAALIVNPAWPTLYRQLSSEYFLFKLEYDSRLEAVQLTMFEINWLWQLELSMLMAVAVTKKCTLAEAAQEVHADRERIAERAMKVIFQTLQKDDEDDIERVGRLHRNLMVHITNPIVQTVLRDHEQILWGVYDIEDLSRWLQSCYASSLGAILFAALVQLIPDINAENLLMDVEGDSIWISEDTGGGIGLISRLSDVIALRPGEFDLQMLDTLQYCDRAHLAEQLQAIAHLVGKNDQDLASTFATIRDGIDLPKQFETRRALTAVLERHGITATRNLVVAMNTKFLRPNSSSDTDKLIATLIRHWQQEEERIGCAIDLRVMAVAALRIPEIKEQVLSVLERINGQPTIIDESQIFNLLQSLLWLNCRDSCPDCIQTHQPFQNLVRPSRSLILSLFPSHVQPILYGSVQWKEVLQQELASRYQSQVSCDQEQITECKQDLLALLTEPVEIGYQLCYPMIERLTRVEQRWVIHLHIREFMYV